jgi:hypothetical protein
MPSVKFDDVTEEVAAHAVSNARVRAGGIAGAFTRLSERYLLGTARR